MSAADLWVRAAVVVCLIPGAASARGPETGEGDVASSAAEAGSLPPAEDAPAEERAAYWFNRGEELGSAGDFVGAARAFETSVELLRTPAGLYNRAVAYEYAKMPVEAISAYAQYLAELDPGAPDVESVEAAIARQKAKVGTIQLRFERGHVPKQIFVDGEERDGDVFPLFVEVGDHQIVVVERNGERREQSQRLGAGQVWTVDFTRPAEAPPRPVFKPPPEFEDIRAEQRRRATRSLFFTGLGLTGLAGAGVAVFGGLTLRERAAFRRQQEQCGAECYETGEPAYPVEHERNFVTFKRTTNVMIGVAAGLASATLVLGVVSFASTRPREGGQEARRRLRLGPQGLNLRF